METALPAPGAGSFPDRTRECHSVAWLHEHQLLTDETSDRHVVFPLGGESVLVVRSVGDPTIAGAYRTPSQGWHIP